MVFSVCTGPLFGPMISILQLWPGCWPSIAQVNYSSRAYTGQIRQGKCALQLSINETAAVSYGGLMLKAIMSMKLGPEFWELSLLFSGKVFLLRVAQHLRQLGIPAVVGQDQDHL
jgi:hypothetical protein